MSFRSKNSPAVAKIKEAAARKLRAQRAKARAFKQRRHALFSTLARTLSIPIADLLIDPRTGFELSARNLHTAKRAAERLERYAVLLAGAAQSDSSKFAQKSVQRPRRRLWPRNRPNVRLWLVDEVVDARFLPLETALSIAEQEDADGVPATKVVDRFRARMGCDWDQAVQMLAASRVLLPEMERTTVEMAANARRFWEHWRQCNRAYFAAVRLSQVEGIQGGDWGLLKPSDVTRLLPGSSLPQNALRDEWLARIIRVEASSDMELDLHARNYNPVVTIRL